MNIFYLQTFSICTHLNSGKLIRMMKNEEKEDDDAEKKNKQSNFIDHIFICTGIVYRLTTRSPKNDV